MKARRETALRVDHSVVIHVLDKLEGDALDGFPRLHDRDGMRETFKVFG